jgi:GNAT superfamily N-acetyltransferase
MTIHVRTPDPHDYAAVPPPEFMPSVRPMRPDELPYAIHSWSQGYKDAPGMRSKTWRDYKALHLQPLRDALVRSDTTRLCVEAGVQNHAVGWIAFAHWPSVDAVHWVYVAKPFRRRGCMRALLAAAELRRHITYTFLGPVLRGRAQPRSDEWIADMLRRSGAVVSHVPYQEWSK